MKTELAYYEIYPKVLPTGRPVSITIRPLGAHAVFSEKFCYQIMIVPLNETNLNSPERPYPRHELIPSKGNLCFDHCFETEGQHTLVITVKQQNRRVLALPVYAAADDLYRLRPYRGDMHCHSYYSDGMEAPAIVAANYRKAGFDFLAITDHGLYEPSREAIDAFREVPIDLRLFPGEEVHPPGNNTHYIHFGGDYSINELMYKNQERYQDELRQLADQLAPPPGINIQEYASCLWVCREIGKAGGLAVMVHPCWIQEYAYHIGEKMSAHLLETKPFDALELTGGLSRGENQMQISLWQQKRAEGFAVPVVGSSDSHGTVNSPWFNISKMVVLAESCERDALIDAVRNSRAVVLEQYAGEELPRLYGIHRYTALVLFLLEEYFPLHDELCFEEGRLMKDYACGDKSAAALLSGLRGRCDRLLEKYWAP